MAEQFESSVVHNTSDEKNNFNIDPVLMKWSEKDRTVVFEPQDEDRFTMKVKEVIQACNIHQQKQVNVFESQFNDLKNILGNWLHAHRDKVNRAFVATRDTRLLLLAITREPEYDRELENDLTKLDLAIANTSFFSAIRLSVQSLPDCEPDCYEAFLGPPILLEYQL